MGGRYHPGEIAVQYRTGFLEPADLIGNGISSEITNDAARFLSLQRWLVIASQSQDGALWVSLLHGEMGFISRLTSDSFVVRATPVAGDPLVANLHTPADVGTLVLDVTTRRRMRLNGRGRFASP